jgi:tRNA nucleotidyltransferase (CCA-adding enzyme)
MKVYLVGGAVRDEQLGRPVQERDWCVVGALPHELTAAGYKPVGKDFPVFLHPQTHEEYALARTERKTAIGYHGFAFNTDPGVSIEDDLSRRDLTINAMAKDADGKLIDPHGGLADIKHRLLRHVSDAFAEDPVRILRTAKFAARFASLGFRIAPETRDLMRKMVAAGEADALVPDRVWKETEEALAGPDPRVFFEALRACRALKVLFPEVDALYGIPQPAQWHPEIDCGLHTMMTLEQACRLSADVEVRFAALVHDLGKATTDSRDLPSHPGHERRGCELIRAMSNRLPVPRACRTLACSPPSFIPTATAWANCATTPWSRCWNKPTHSGAPSASPNSCWPARPMRVAERDSKIAITRRQAGYAVHTPLLRPSTAQPSPASTRPARFLRLSGVRASRPSAKAAGALRRRKNTSTPKRM